MEKGRLRHSDVQRIVTELVVRNHMTRVLVDLTREVERLSDDNEQLRSAVGFYRAALETNQAERHRG